MSKLKTLIKTSHLKMLQKHQLRKMTFNLKSRLLAKRNPTLMIKKLSNSMPTL